MRSAVIVRAGRRSTHAGWLRGAVPEFDLIVLAYEALPPELIEGAARHLLIPGNKVAGWSQFLLANPEVFQDYDHIALLDNDLICSAADINHSFALGRHHGLSLWQPSLSWRSHFSYGVFLHNPSYQLRFVNFIEMMCPFFTAAHLQNCLPILQMGLETGIDRLWCRIKTNPFKAYAVLDAVQITHSQPVGNKRGEQGFTTDYQTVIDQMEAATNVYFRGPVAYAGISRSGRDISGRWRMALGAIRMLAAAAQSPNVKSGWFFRPVTDHIRHNLTRPIDNEPVDFPRASGV